MSVSPLFTKYQEMLQQQLTNAISEVKDTNQLEDLNQLYLNYLARAEDLPEDNIFKPFAIRQGDWPIADTYNSNFQEVHNLLQLFFRWLKSLGDTEVKMHNYLLSQYLGIKSQINTLAGTIADLELFQKDTAGGVCLFGDAFLSASKVDSTTKRDIAVAYFDRDLQAVTLPLNTIVYKPPVESIKLNNASNGVSGNNQQLNITKAYNDIMALSDGDLTTWYEYEKVSAYPLVTPLVLDFTMSYTNETLLNRLSIYLNNLGSTMWPQVKDILVSLDGKNFISLQDEIRELCLKSDPFEIAPQATQTGGLLTFCFKPRAVKHLRLVIQQNGYYMIDTSAGQRYRYAIGLREVLGIGLSYTTDGEFISMPYTFTTPISKVMLDSQESYMASDGSCLVRHFVSSDGETWRELQPVSGVSAELPKIISFSDKDITTLVYRALLGRREEIAISKSLAQYSIPSTEYLPFPTSPPYALYLANAPEDGSISVYLPFAGSVGKNTKLYLGASDGAAGQFFNVPFELLGDEEIWINKQKWSRVDNMNNSNVSDQVYTVNYATNTITFGNGINGLIPTAGFGIYLWLPAESLLMQSGEVVTTSLRHNTLKDKNTITIYRVDQSITMNKEILARGASMIRLSQNNIAPNAIITFTGTDLSSFQSRQSYIDGSTELNFPGHYSVDCTLGIIHTYTPTPIDSNCYATYLYIPRTALSSTDWEFNENNGIDIAPEAFKTQEVTAESLSGQAGNYVIDLMNTHVVLGTIAFNGTGAPTQELGFINGLAEFSGITLQRDESVPSGQQSFTLQHIPRQDYQVTFTDNVIFAHEVLSISQVTSAGSYYIDYETGQVYTYLITGGGQVNYYYHLNLTTLDGSYSVDYTNGKIHLYQPLASSINVNYQFCNYEAEYYIAETVPSSSYQIDATNKIIHFLDLAYLSDLKTRFSGESAMAVSYTYLAQEQIDQKALQMLTPLLQSYGMRILFKEVA